MAGHSRLSVNINAVAYLRNRRDLPWPDPIIVADHALAAGAKGITVHPRPDERHITAADVARLARLMTEKYPDREYCLEGYPDPRFMDLVARHRPDQVLLVPDDPAQTTSDHGWDFRADGAALRGHCGHIAELSLRPALFIDPDPAAARAAADCGAARIEIYTGRYGECHDRNEAAMRELAAITRTADAARAAGLGINAGHDLTCANLPELLAKVPDLAEVSIGHGFAAEAFICGAAGAVRRFRAALGELSPDGQPA